MALVVVLMASFVVASGFGTPAATASTSASSVAAPPYPPGPGSVSGGGGHFCVHTYTGSVKCWGYNATGALGDGTTTNRTTPGQVPGDSASTLAASLEAGGQTTCTVTVQGGARC